MRKILAASLVALVAACAKEDERKPIQYGAPRAPGYTEQGAIAGAQTTLQQNVVFQAPTQPTAGAAGLGDQLVANLGGYQVNPKTADGRSAKVAAAAIRRAFDTGGMNPDCVRSVTDPVTGVTTVTWGATTPCVIHVEDVDPYSGDTLTMDVTVAGTMTWNPATGETGWDIGETYGMSMTSGGQPIVVDGNAHLGGTMTVTPTTIAIGSSSTMYVRTNYMGLTFDEGIETTLAADLDYQAEPFCITGGDLTVEQYWTKRPMGATERDLPNQGWKFTWTGCDQFTVSPGF